MTDPVSQITPQAPPPPRRGRRRAALAALLLLLLLGGALLHHFSRWPFGSRSLFGAAGAGAAAGPFTVYYTCDTAGSIEPCRCSNGQTGGMSRRIGWLKSQKDQPALLVDAGDVTAGSLDWQLLEFDYILKGYEEAGYHAVNVGFRELTLGRDRLRALKNGKVPFVSANVFDDTGKLILDPYRIVTLPGGMKAGVIGVVDTDYDPARLGANLKVGPPAEALARWLPEVKSKAGAVVLLAFASEASIQAMAEKFDDIDVIVGGNTYIPTGDPLKMGKSLVVLITDKGKAIGHLQLEPSATGDKRWTAKNEIVKLTEDLMPDKKYEAVYEDYKTALAKQDFRPQSADTRTSGSRPGRAPGADKYVGVESCRGCHAAACEAWGKTKHATAFKSLADQNNHYNPRCLPCHTVGYGATDGYVNPALTPALENVQCEACHGRGDYHARLRRGESIPARLAAFKKVDCATCHNQERSPLFDFETYWKKIEHGKGGATP